MADKSTDVGNMKGEGRSAAARALTQVLRGECFIEASLETWDRTDQPSRREYHLAQEIAYGTCRMQLALEYIGRQLAERRLPKKAVEKALLLCALYEASFLSQPLYAVVDSWVTLAKKLSPNRAFAPFLNATLRRLERGVPLLPSGSTPEALSIRYSQPRQFVDELLACYDAEITEKLLAEANTSAPTVVRYRGEGMPPFMPETAWQPVIGTHFPTAIVRDSQLLPQIVAMPELHIQNATPATIMHTLAQGMRPPRSVLDLCAAPGGKLVVAHDLFPKARLFANDISAIRLRRLYENCRHFGLEVTVSQSSGTEFTSDEAPFDLIIVDAPCSNSGVFNRRPEARWRYNDEQLSQLQGLQKSLLEHASTLLSEEGELWYMTCSISPRENEALILDFCRHSGFAVRQSSVVLPLQEGWDGGYGAAIRVSKRLPIQKPKRHFGVLKGKIKISKDFDAPLSDEVFE